MSVAGSASASHVEVFNPRRVEAEVDRAHMDYESREERDPFVADPSEVAAYAEQLARRRYGLRRSTRSLGRAQFTVTAGRCIYALDHYGWSFIDLSRVATYKVAQVVAAVSADTRLNIKPGRDELVKRTGLLGFCLRRRDEAGRLAALENAVALYRQALADGFAVDPDGTGRVVVGPSDEEAILRVMRDWADVAADAQVVRMAEVLASAERLAAEDWRPGARGIDDREAVLLWVRRQWPLIEALSVGLFADRKFGREIAWARRWVNEVYAKIQRPRDRRAAAAPAPAAATFALVGARHDDDGLAMLSDETGPAANHAGLAVLAAAIA